MPQSSFPYIDLLDKTLEQRMLGGIQLENPKEALQVWTSLHRYKQALTTSFNFPGQETAKNNAYAQKLEKLDHFLAENLAPAVHEDPHVVKISGKSDIAYNVAGHDMLFKIDTGAVTTVVDATNIVWNIEPEQRTLLETCYNTYVDINPDLGPMTQELMQETSPGIIAPFPPVTSFSMVTYEWGADPELDAEQPEELCKEKGALETVDMAGSFPVVGISNPMTKGRRKGLNPVIDMALQGPGFDAPVDYPVSLARRPGMTRRGLASRNLMRAAGLSLVFNGQKAPVLDLDKVDFPTLSTKMAANGFQP